jgi:predicted ArsR family transcriptional regulator
VPRSAQPSVSGPVRGTLGAERALTLAGELLAARGFEPARESPTSLRLRNCPFHPLTSTAPELVCGLNHAFLTGMVDGLQATTVAAVLDPGRASAAWNCGSVRLKTESSGFSRSLSR